MDFTATRAVEKRHIKLLEEDIQVVVPRKQEVRNATKSQDIFEVRSV